MKALTKTTLLGMLGLFLCSLCFSQTSGYLGKRLYAKAMFNYPIGYGFTLIEPTPIRSPAPIPMPSLEVNYVLNNSFSAGIHGEYFKSFRAYEYDTIPGSFFSSLDTSIAVMSGARFGAQIKWFAYSSQGNLAPLGPFLSFRISRAQYTVTDRDGRNEINGEPLNDKRSATFFQPGVGANLIVADRILLSGQAQLGLGRSNYSWFGIQTPDKFELGHELVHRYYTEQYFFGYMVLQFSLGMGVLIY